MFSITLPLQKLKADYEKIVDTETIIIYLTKTDKI
jgi:hypothetical protein